MTQITKALQEKAERLVDQEKVTQLEGYRYIFKIEGDSGTYTAMISDPESVTGRCDCPAGSAGNLCSHLLAASIFYLAAGQTTFFPDPDLDPFEGLS